MTMPDLPPLGSTSWRAPWAQWVHDQAAKVWNKLGVADLSATGTPSATTFLRGDGTWATPPAGGTVADATTTTKGIVELATTAETTTGTDTVRAVTPAGVKAVADTKITGTHVSRAAWEAGPKTPGTLYVLTD